MDLTKIVSHGYTFHETQIRPKVQLDYPSVVAQINQIFVRR